MVNVLKKKSQPEVLVSIKWLLLTISMGIICLLIPLTVLFYDPILTIAQYYIRLANGTIFHDIMLSKIEGPRLYVNLFNLTNAEEFTSGRDEKIKLKEIGPFVYQEYRINQDVQIHPDTDLMTYIPRLWTEFIPEESIGDPKKMYFTVPSLPMLLGTDLMSKYPFVLRNVFNILAAGTHSKAIINITAHDYLWGYDDPLIKIINTAVPGLFYYNSSGLLERMFDRGTTYAFEVGTKGDDKLKVKRVDRYRETESISGKQNENVQTFTNAYEGAAFPPGLTPEKPINIYRHSVCKTFKFQHLGYRKTKYGSDAFVYGFDNDTLNDHKTCNSKGWCPSGLMNLAPCYCNFPYALSRGHFFGSDPKLFEKLEGLKPDEKIHHSEIIIDPLLGVTLSAYISFQVSMALGDVTYNPEARRFKDTILPICHTILRQRKPPDQAIMAFTFVYVYGPYIRVFIYLGSILLGLALLAYSAKLIYLYRETRRTSILDNNAQNNMHKRYMLLPLKP